MNEIDKIIKQNQDLIDKTLKDIKKEMGGEETNGKNSTRPSKKVKTGLGKRKRSKKNRKSEVQTSTKKRKKSLRIKEERQVND